MKKTITLLSLAFSALVTNAQTLADFETFTLSPNSAYSPSATIPFQTSNAVFNHVYNFGFWLGGFAYTNINDSITAGFTNSYGVRAGKGYANSSMYTVGQDRGLIKLKSPFNTVNGFYITNTTYAYKSMASGDAFSRKFGDTTGTGSGTTIAQGSYPDFFKVIIKGYKNGLLRNDSVTVLLADYTFTNNVQDFILNTWQYVNTSIIGDVDSIQFFMRSSDVGQFGINTPLYFALDNFETSISNPVGIIKHLNEGDFEVYPNPFSSSITIHSKSSEGSIKLMDISGKVVATKELDNLTFEFDLSALKQGIYFLELSQGNQKTIKKIIKN